MYRYRTLRFVICVAAIMTLLGCQQAKRSNRLGIEVLNLSPQVDGGPGALISAIYPCTCAQSAELRLGDVITAIGNQAVDGGERLTKILDSLPSGTTITIDIQRSGEKIQLTALPDLVDMTDRARAVPYSGLDSWRANSLPLVASCVLPGSPAAAAGLQKGDIIDAIAGQAVNTNTFADVLANLGTGREVLFTLRRGTEHRTAQVKLANFAAVPERLQVTEISDALETVERVLDVEKLRLDNCNGTEVRDSKRALTRRRSSKFDLGVSADLNTYGFLPMLIAEGKIKAHLNYDETNELAETKEEIMRASPGTVANYFVRWYEISTSGTVTIAAGKHQHKVPFKLTRQLRGEIESLPATPCTKTTRL